MQRQQSWAGSGARRAVLTTDLDDYLTDDVLKKVASWGAALPNGKILWRGQKPMHVEGNDAQLAPWSVVL